MREFTNEQIDSEIWEDLKNFENICKISTLGRIKTLDRVITNKKGFNTHIEGRILKLGYYSNGYEQFSIVIDGIRHTAIVHRLVAQQFIPNTYNYPIVNHKNGIRDDNRVENLEWCTASENMLHSFKDLGRVPKNNTGINNPKAILSEEQILEIRKLHKEGVSQENLSKIYNMNPPAIWKIIHKYTWKHI